MKTNEDEMEPSEKYKQFQKSAVVINDKKISQNKNNLNESQVSTSSPIRKRKLTFVNFYYFAIELLIFVVGFIGIGSVTYTDSLIFDVESDYLHPFNIVDLNYYIFVVITIVSLLAFINTYLYIYKLNPKNRLPAYIIRVSASIIYLIDISYIIIHYADYSIVGAPYFLLSSIFAIYGICSRLIIKTFLLSTEEKTSLLLFKKPVAGSPAENEWRRYYFLSGIIAEITGFFMLQIIWLIYHIIIRPITINNTKNRLILESLDFNKDVNLSTVALELGIPLEEVIYRIKKLEFKQEIKGEFTRYGFVLKDIKKVKWMTSKLSEKYANYTKELKRSAQEINVNKIFEVAEKGKLLESDFRKLFGIKKEVSLKDLQLLLPLGAMTIKTNLLTKQQSIIFNTDVLLKNREKITETLLSNYSQLFKK